MTTWYYQLLELCILIPKSKGVTVDPSLVVHLFIVIEKADTTWCFKIIWRLIQHTALKYSVEGCCSFTSDWLVLRVELLFVLLKLLMFSSGTECLGEKKEAHGRGSPCRVREKKRRALAAEKERCVPTLRAWGWGGGGEKKTRCKLRWQGVTACIFARVGGRNDNLLLMPSCFANILETFFFLFCQKNDGCQVVLANYWSCS
jgi:hypothetical protein